MYSSCIMLCIMLYLRMYTWLQIQADPSCPKAPNAEGDCTEGRCQRLGTWGHRCHQSMDNGCKSRCKRMDSECCKAGVAAASPNILGVL